MNTQEIISFVSKSFNDDIKIEVPKFSDWAVIYRYWEQSWKDDTVERHIPLRDPVIKLVYKKLYGIMPFDKEYVLKRYERSLDELEYLIYPSVNPKKIMVFFSGYSERKTYNRYSWYWDQSESWSQDTSYIFVRDPENLWYSQDRYAIKLRNILTKCVQDAGLRFKDCTFIGGSMGGYGALKHGIELSAGGVVAIHPQLSLEATKLHHDPTWFNNINSLGDSFVEIASLVKGDLPKIYLEYGEYEADKVAAKKLIESYDANNGVLVVAKHSSQEHVTASPDRKTLDSICSFFAGS